MVKLYADERHVDVANALISEGFRQLERRAHAVGFERRPGEIVYVKNTKTKKSLVLDPRFCYKGDVIGGIYGYMYWNSNLLNFEKRMRGGKKPERCGMAFDFSAVDFIKQVSAHLRSRF